MGNELLSAKTDIVFKKIFIENEDLLQDFLANMLFEYDSKRNACQCRNSGQETDRL